MTIEQTDVIDFVSRTHGGEMVLTISDHLPWDEGGRHLLLLQEKLNAYLRFIEGGELKEHHSEYDDQAVVINVVLKFPPNHTGKRFFEKAGEAIAAAGFELRHEIMWSN